MARTARIVIPGVSHHITQRGNNKQRVFWENSDMLRYLEYLAKRSETYGFEIQAYCLMLNHVHVVGVPLEEYSLAKAIGSTNRSYTQSINRKYDRSGHLWQNRFYSCPMDSKHTLAAIQYVEQNPVRAGLANSAIEYKWSSAREHSGLCEPSGMLSGSLVEQLFSADKWQEILSKKAKDRYVKTLNQSIKSGRPAGNQRFKEQISERHGIDLTVNPVGRPPRGK